MLEAESLQREASMKMLSNLSPSLQTEIKLGKGVGCVLLC